MYSETKNHFFLWTKESCPYCVSAIELLEKNNIPFTVHTIDEKPELLVEVQKNVGVSWKTVPLILEQQASGERKFVGGFTDLREYLGISDG